MAAIRHCRSWAVVARIERTAAKAIQPETRKQAQPRTSGVHTRRSYSWASRPDCMARKVLTLNRIVPANWMPLPHQSASRPSVSRHWIAAAVVKKTDPTK